MVYSKDYDSSKESVQQGGRFASASDNIKNKANTARLQGEPTFQVIDAQGNTLEYNAAEYRQYQEQQKQQQAQQQRQQEIQKQQSIQRDNRRQDSQSGLYSGISNYDGIPRSASEITKYQVTTPDGKARTFNTEQNAKKFSNNYGNEITKYQVTTPDGKVRTFNTQQNAKKFADNFGNQATIKPLIGPSNDVFFVGANAQGYTIKQPREEKPLQTGISLLDKPRGKVEQFFEGTSRVFTNFASQSKDFVESIKTNTLQSPKPFSDPNNPFGLPVPKYNTPLKPTASGELFQGKIPDLSKPEMLGSAASEAGLLALGIKSGSITSKFGNKITTTKNQKLIEKSLKGLESPKVLTTEKIQKIGPSFPNAGEFLTTVYKKTKYRFADVLKEGDIKITPVKGTTNYFKVESQNPLQDKLVFAKANKDNIIIKTFEPESIIPPKGVRIRTNPKDDLGVELSKFNLEKQNIGIYQTKPKSDLTNIQKAMGSESVKPVARTREFSLEQITQNPKEFSRYLFQETTVGKPPLKPLSDITLAETRSFGTVGSKINTYPKTELDIPLRGNQYDMPSIFKAFKETKVRVGESFVKGRNIRFTKPKYFKKKSTLDTFVYDIQKNIRVVDPFSTSEFFKSKPGKSFSKGQFKITDDEAFGKNQGQIFAKSPQEFKTSIEKQIQKEIKSNKKSGFATPRSSGLVFATQQETLAYPETRRTKNEFDFIYKNQPKIKTTYRTPLNEFSILKEKTKNEFDFGVVSIQMPKIKDMLKPSTKTNQPQTLIPRIITDQIPRQTTKTTPITTLITTPITVPKTTPITTPIPIQEIPVITPRFGFPPYFPSAFFGSGGYESPSSLKKGFAAYGISSDINIKTLPTYSRYSSATNIFKDQAKEDKRIQNIFYGKPRKKSKSKKSKGKSTKRKR